METKNYIRLVAAVGAYLLLRPYLIKLGAKQQRKQHEMVDHPPETNPAKISANALRGQVPEDSDDDEGAQTGNATGGGGNWGKKARKRQRQVLKKLLEAEEQRLKELEEAEEDKDLEEFLMRYSATGREVALES